MPATDSISSVFRSRGWAKTWLAYSTMLLLPFVFPITSLSCTGYAVARVGRASQGNDDLPEWDFKSSMASGFGLLVGSVAWSVLSVLTLGIASLAFPAFIVEYSRTGKMGSLFAFRPVLLGVTRNVRAYAVAMAKAYVPVLALAIVSGSAIAWATTSAVHAIRPGSTVVEMISAAWLSAALGLVAYAASAVLSFPVAMASGYFLGQYGLAVGGPPVGDFTPLNLAAAMAAEDDSQFSGLDNPLPAAIRTPPLVVRGVPVATFSARSERMNPNLPGQRLMYDEGSFTTPALPGKRLGFHEVALIHASGLLSWERDDVRDAVLIRAKQPEVPAEQ